ncbi:hypothetical protein KIL84_015294 [Mauremys mutica]|uniref:Uncharacterized protein n=1 Tax=Mauremys mutica TaxID=74926 RepID=A0A9D4AM20_9SAUR|nr:hypothetical protein KIL84_015294 [Mauremys mutica]
MANEWPPPGPLSCRALSPAGPPACLAELLPVSLGVTMCSLSCRFKWKGLGLALAPRESVFLPPSPYCPCSCWSFPAAATQAACSIPGGGEESPSGCHCSQCLPFFPAWPWEPHRDQLGALPPRGVLWKGWLSSPTEEMEEKLHESAPARVHISLF